MSARTDPTRLAERTADYVRQIVEQYPPLSDEKILRLSMLVRPAALALRSSRRGKRAAS